MAYPAKNTSNYSAPTKNSATGYNEGQTLFYKLLIDNSFSLLIDNLYFLSIQSFHPSFSTPSKNSSSQSLPSTDRNKYDDSAISYDSSALKYDGNYTWTYQSKS